MNADVERAINWLKGMADDRGYIEHLAHGGKGDPIEEQEIECASTALKYIESLQAQLAKEKRRAEKAVKVLERIKRDINEQDKIYIHIADYFGRGIYIDEEEGDTVAYFTLCKDNELGDVYKCASCGNEMYGNMPKYCSECGKRIVGKEDAVVRGEWEVAIGYDPNKKVQCQNCYKMAYEPTSYCPNCGAKMEDKP
jgi:ribosomal protein L37E